MKGSCKRQENIIYISNDMNDKPSPIDYVNVMANEDGVSIKPIEKRHVEIPMQTITVFTLKDRWNLLKDNWNFSIKPMLLDYNFFDFGCRELYHDTHELDFLTATLQISDPKIPKIKIKTTPWSRLKELVSGVYYILKSTWTYVPLTAIRYTKKSETGFYW